MQIYEMLAQIGYIDANATTNNASAKKPTESGIYTSKISEFYSSFAGFKF